MAPLSNLYAYPGGVYTRFADANTPSTIHLFVPESAVSASSNSIGDNGESIAGLFPNQRPREVDSLGKWTSPLGLLAILTALVFAYSWYESRDDAATGNALAAGAKRSDNSYADAGQEVALKTLSDVDARDVDYTPVGDSILELSASNLAMEQSEIISTSNGESTLRIITKKIHKTGDISPKKAGKRKRKVPKVMAKCLLDDQIYKMGTRADAVPPATLQHLLSNSEILHKHIGNSAIV